MMLFKTDHFILQMFEVIMLFLIFFQIYQIYNFVVNHVYMVIRRNSAL